MHHTWVEISRTAFLHNLSTLGTFIAPSSIALVVKSNAYGHGMLPIAQMGDAHPLVTHICTISLDEALELRAQGIAKPLIVLGSWHEQVYDSTQNIALPVYDMQSLARVIALAKKLERTIPVHIKIDTGMARLGFLPEQFLSLINQFQDPHIYVEGIFTHIADKDNSDQTFTHQQLTTFKNIIATAQAAGFSPPLTHALSSGALEMGRDYRFSCARIGTNVYGFWSSTATQHRVKTLDPSCTLQPILSWKTKILQIKELAPGTSVGYNRSFFTKRPTRIAILPIGYYDSYARALGNTGVMYVHGQKAAVIGIVSMNVTTLDITDIPQAHVGSEVTILGNRPEASADDIARELGTIAIEITTRINPLIPRIVVD